MIHGVALLPPPLDVAGAKVVVVVGTVVVGGATVVVGASVVGVVVGGEVVGASVVAGAAVVVSPGTVVWARAEPPHIANMAEATKQSTRSRPRVEVTPEASHAGPLPSRTVSAGDFLRWLADIDAVLQDGEDAHVPCNGCTVCCRSSQFVHVAPDETETLGRIPPQLLFPAPHMPPGYVVMGYDERGHCPMLVDDRCSIYEHRPRACRAYDCRVFTATGIEPDSPLLKERVTQWEFAYPTDRDRDAHRSLRASAAQVPTSESAARRAIQAIVERKS